MSDNKKTRRFVTPNDEVKSMLSGKFAGMLERPVVKPEREKDVESQQIERTINQRVMESLDNKFVDYFAKQGVFTGKYAASKYIGQSISNLMTEERRVSNLIEDIEERKASLIEEVKKFYRKSCSKVAGWSEERVEVEVKTLVDNNIIGTYGTEEREIEAHQKYAELENELLQAKADKNAIAVAKADYMEQNADLIREAQENNRRKEFEESGLLEELGIVKSAKVKAEEKSKEIEEKAEESEEQEDESNISE
ncbi:hypothetical protein [Blautia sp. MSJ-36]|uniref:hypothetical protein n=1 Tax=Blautia sp. MSJ-36 TaxID=2841530 RepID=UPI001C0FA801|nr:hypothetical protein [Blautia sp. MSJ-36]MBU5445715.1 hypothetical protein [Blautia sp. MSJ-36]